jgi:hypothetical protein
MFYKHLHWPPLDVTQEAESNGDFPKTSSNIWPILYHLRTYVSSSRLLEIFRHPDSITKYHKQQVSLRKKTKEINRLARVRKPEKLKRPNWNVA